MVVQEYYLTLIRDKPTGFIGPFRSWKEAGNFNKNECKGQYRIYHYESHRLNPFTGEVTSPEDFLTQKENEK